MGAHLLHPQTRNRSVSCILVSNPVLVELFTVMFWRVQRCAASPPPCTPLPSRWALCRTPQSHQVLNFIFTPFYLNSGIISSFFSVYASCFKSPVEMLNLTDPKDEKHKVFGATLVVSYFGANV